MFAPLVDAATGGATRYYPISLPGFGAPVIPGQATSLETLASYLIECAETLGADTVLAHSVASIIASIAASRPNSPLTSVLSLEGNLTRDDAYFSGTAAQYTSPPAFRAAFLGRLEAMAKHDAIIKRYREVVENANPQAL